MIKKILITVLIVLALLGAAFFYLRQVFYTPFKPGDKSVIVFEVKEGEGLTEISNKLANKGIIRTNWHFMLYAKKIGGSLLPGYYELSPEMKLSDIFDSLHGGKTKIVKVTIPEGWRTEEIGQILAEKGLVDFKEFTSKAKMYEGKLFPETYFLVPNKPVEYVINKMLDVYSLKTKGLEVSSEDLIVASIVEREAINDEERVLIAGVYKNRLAIKMALEADPTVQYGKDSIAFASDPQNEDFDFWKPIKLVDYHSVNSNYNTYKIRSLPPGPICSPGIKSIEATINYGKHNFLFFLQRDGKIYPSETLDQHNKYRREILGAKI